MYQKHEIYIRKTIKRRISIITTRSPEMSRSFCSTYIKMPEILNSSKIEENQNSHPNLINKL